MKRIQLFLGSVQKEFASERITPRDYLRADPLLRRFFDPQYQRPGHRPGSESGVTSPVRRRRCDGVV